MRRLGSEAAIGLGTVAFIAAEAVLALSHGLGLGLVAALLGGVGWVLTLTTLNVAMQVRSPDAILGRCLAISRRATRRT